MAESGILDSLFSLVFKPGPVFLKTENLNAQVELVRYDSGLVYLDLSGFSDNNKSTVIFHRKSEEIIFSKLNFVKAAGDFSVFEPENLQILKTPRKESRKEIEKNKSESVYISNIISDFVIKNQLDNNKKRIESIKWDLGDKLRVFDSVRIFFLNEKSIDLRMKFFSETRKPLFIPDITDKFLNSKNEEVAFFIEKIYATDSLFLSQNYVSEISLPLFYKMIFPVGYIQINHRKPLSDSEFSKIRKLGVSLSELISREGGIVTLSKDCFSVVDLSLHGLALVFQEKTMIRHFKADSILYFTLFLPANQQAAMLAVVRNIQLMKNRFYRVGCEIIDIDSIGEAVYTDYVESLD